MAVIAERHMEASVWSGGWGGAGSAKKLLTLINIATLLWLGFLCLLELCSFCCCCSVAQSCLTLCNPMDCSMPGFPVLHHLPEFGQKHVDLSQ